MKKIYISIPITGIEIEQIKNRIQQVMCNNLLDSPKYYYYNPLELYADLWQIKSIIHNSEDKPTYEEIMGYDISYLLQSDAVFFCKGWHESKGCQLEFAAAKIFGKEIMFE